MTERVAPPAAGSAEAPACASARWELCRLAAGTRLSDERDLARHLQGCPRCDEFADALGRVCAWLRAANSVPLATPSGPPLRHRIREALTRELEARFARDLLAVGQGRAPRPLPERAADLERLESLVGAGALQRDPRRAVLRWIRGGSRPSRGEALRLANRLDPLGLDVALAWLGALVRAGQHVEAHRLADRILAEV